MSRTNTLVLFFVLALFSYSATAQQEAPPEARQHAGPPAGPPAGSKIRLFLDCNGAPCDRTYIRTEINLIDFVYDRTVADVHLLLTDQRMGNGGISYQLIFFGQRQFSAKKDTLQFSMLPSATPVEYRERLVSYIKAGLVPFVVQTSWFNELSIGMKTCSTDTGQHTSIQKSDKWNFWVFSLGGRGNITADQNYKSSQVNGFFSVNRTVPQNRTELSVDYGKQRSDFEYVNDNDSIEAYSVRNSNWSIDHVFVNSLSPHWSYGYYFYTMNSTFSNYRHSIRISPTIEYNIFPYDEVNNKYFSLSYGINARYNSYYEETVYEKSEEWLYGHRLRAVVSFKQRWGNFNATASYFNYLQDWSLNSVSFNLNTNVRVKGNLSFFVYLYGGLSHDQVFIAKGESNVQDVLARRKQLASGYRYGTSFGVNYRFGSIQNNFINPRFSNRI